MQSSMSYNIHDLLYCITVDFPAKVLMEKTKSDHDIYVKQLIICPNWLQSADEYGFPLSPFS